jgi:flagellar biosynthesis protein FlhF
MRYVKIKAKTYNEAMMKLKVEHGNDAIPISHKYIKEGGVLNSKLFAKEVVELTAGVQDKKTVSRAPKERKKVDYTVGEKPGSIGDLLSRAGNTSGHENSSVDNISKTIDALNDNLNTLRDNKKVASEKQSIYTEPVVRQSHDSVKNDEGVSIKSFEKEFHELKSALNQLINTQDKPQEARKICEEEHTLLNKYNQLLEKNDFSSEDRENILIEVKNSISKEDLKDEYKIEKNLKDLLKSRIVTTGPIKLGNKKKIVMFVGPTGAGKTTTMAKLGALNSLREGKKVVFITIDNYRIAATEQLKKYAEIMKIPIYAVNDQKEFKSIIAREKADIILVDTSGRSHRNQLKISEIKSFADLIEYDFEKVLCVSASTKKDDLNDVFRAFNTLNFSSVVITKVDETSHIGNVVDIADKYKKPISYYTNGQEVPNDIEVAETDKIVDMIIGSTI